MATVIDTTDQEHEYLVKVEVPGYDIEDMELSVIYLPSCPSHKVGLHPIENNPLTAYYAPIVHKDTIRKKP